MANFWDNDPIVSPAPQAPAPQPDGGTAPSTGQGVAPADAAQPSPAASAAPAPGGNFWENDPVVSPAPQDTSVLGQIESGAGALAHGAGVVGRGLVHGVASLPAIVSDGITGPINAGLDATLGHGNGFRFQSTQHALDNVMTSAGVPTAQNAPERIASAAAQGVGSAVSGVGLGMAIEQAATGPFTAAVGKMLQHAPLMQLASGATGGAAQQVAQEAGASPGVQTAAGIAGSLLPMAGAIPRAASGAPQLQQAAQEARAAGYVVPPADLNPGPVAQVASAVSGKIKTAQVASAKNQEITNTLAKRALGLPEDQPLTIEALDELRNEAANSYAPIAGAGTITPTAGYGNALDKAIEPYLKQAQSFPDRALPPVVKDIQSLKTPQFDAGDALNTIRVLRSQADTAYRSGDTLAGAAYKQAGKALEDQIESHLAGQGAQSADLLDAFRNGRTQIAKSYSVQRALNPVTGNVNAGALVSALNKGKPLTGDLLTIANAARAFPKATQALKEAPGSMSVLDIGGGTLSSLGAHSPIPLAATLSRPVVRSALLSGPVQDRMVQDMVKPGRAGGLGVPATLTGAAERALQGPADQTPPATHYADGGTVQPTAETFRVYPAAARARRAAGIDAEIVRTADGFVVRPKAAQAEASQMQNPFAGYADGGQVQPAGAPTADIDAKAHEAASSPLNDRPEPTPAQAQAGNYRKGHVTVQGMQISIENPAGSTRRGVDPDGTPWESTLTQHYGYVKGSKGADGDHLDVFVGPTPESKTVHVIDQLKPDGSFDEHKAMVGYPNEYAARSAYLSNYPPGQESRIGAMTALPVSAFKAWATKSGQLKEPLAYEPPAQAAGS